MAEEPTDLVSERERLVAEIHEAFAGVTREGGVSWSEGFARDGYRSEVECIEARRRDKDQSWVDLLDDEKWQPNIIGAWAFLDPIGFRYYLPAAMIRSIRLGYDDGVEFHLMLEPGDPCKHMSEKWPLLDDRQRRCISRFLRYMIAVSRENGSIPWIEDWLRIYESYWSQFAIE
jgi:hypothetical protein